MNIILIGMRGSGKSTVGKLLAKKTQREFFDLDKLLSEYSGMSISELVHMYGWEYFRDKETEITEEYAQKEDAIIATGGGVILRKKNTDALGKKGRFVFLKTSIETILNRIGYDKNRPALTNKKTFKEELEDVWNERKVLYEAAANVTIETDDKSVEEITNEIISLLKEN